MRDQPAIDHEAFKQFERDGYSRVAEGYDKATAQVTSQANDTILNALGTGRGTRLLDVACGPGCLSAAAVQRGGGDSHGIGHCEAYGGSCLFTLS